MSVSIWAFLAVVALNLYLIGRWWWAERHAETEIARMTVHVEGLAADLENARKANEQLVAELRRTTPSGIAYHPTMFRRKGAS